jgi:hypothetical protein
MPTNPRPFTRLAVLVAVVAMTTACSAAAAPQPAQTSAAPAPTSSGPSTTPDDPVAGGGSTGGGSIGDPGTGVDAPPVGATPVDPAVGQPTIVMPKPGRLNPHPVSPQTLQTSIEGRRVLVKVSWYSGIAPCSVLDSVKIERSGTTIALTVIEGSDDLGAMCAEIAMLKATIVDVGELEPGTWTITAPNSDAPPVDVTIV